MFLCKLMYVCMYVCMCVRMCVCINICMYDCIYVERMNILFHYSFHNTIIINIVSYYYNLSTIIISSCLPSSLFVCHQHHFYHHFYHTFLYIHTLRVKQIHKHRLPYLREYAPPRAEVYEGSPVLYVLIQDDADGDGSDDDDGDDDNFLY